MCYTYVLRCIKDNSYYVGSIKVIENRLKVHAKGYVKYTKPRLPIELVFLKHFENYSEARRFEMQIKSWKKRKSIERMFNKSDNIANKYCGIV
ncbi:GIY-YIG nuclease family protein [Candidatus Daviesbacteria bacterium]|nr:GIY-YIG nuclease family protein [Candidatus Daviesbacteria bacterium]